MGRIIIFTGKGGVGKTSVAAAHAWKAAQKGMNTLLVSADMAHNLSDLFEQKIGRTVTNICEHLDALEIDPEYELENDFSYLKEAVAKMLPSISVDSNQDLSDFSMIPGIEEMFSLLKLNALYQSGEYDLIVVDCAPTGETLALLKFPELFSWYIEKLFPIGKVAMKVMRPIGKAMFQVELPNTKAMNDIQKLYLKLSELETMLKDKQITSVRLVATPEKMVLEETKRNYMYLNLYNYNVDGLFINRVLPKDMTSAFFDDWIAIQEKYMEEYRSVFDAIPILYIPWYEEEVSGKEAIAKIANSALDVPQLFEIRVTKRNEIFEKVGDCYNLLVQMPFLEKRDLDLYENGKELILRIGNFKRCIPLPDVLREYEVTGAKLEEGELRVTFSKMDHGKKEDDELKVGEVL